MHKRWFFGEILRSSRDSFWRMVSLTVSYRSHRKSPLFNLAQFSLSDARLPPVLRPRASLVGEIRVSMYPVDSRKMSVQRRTAANSWKAAPSGRSGAPF